MNDKINFTELEKKIEYSFNDKSILVLALTHSSYANEHKIKKIGYNERLEFLGDAALELIISKFIYERFPKMPEGELTKLRAGVVCESSLAKKAREIGLGDFLLLGNGEDITGGRNRESVLADVFEAVIGAVYIDGGFECAEDYVLRFMEPVVEDLKDNFKSEDYKTRLQEIIQKTSKLPISYIIVDETGPDHSKNFVAKVAHNGCDLGKGVGRSKKEAEQSAAKAAIDQMEI